MNWRYIHKSEGLIYNLLVNPCLFAQHACFRRIEIWGKERVPTNQPLIIAANHPTAFMDPILLCALLDQPMYNMTRGDIFEKPWANRLLRSMNMFPVFRAKDGYGSSRRNTAVFEYILEKLSQRKTIVIFVEGEHHLDNQLKPLQKGIAHIAQQAIEKPGLQDTLILPIGFNYINGAANWDEVGILVGNPFKASDFLIANAPSDEQHQRFLEKIRFDLLGLVHHIDDKESQPIFDLAKVLVKNNRKEPILPQIKHNERSTFDQLQTVQDRIEFLHRNIRDITATYIKNYNYTLQKAEITDAEVEDPSRPGVLGYLFLILGAIPCFIGWVAATPIRKTAKWLIINKIRKPEFYSSVRLGVGVVLGLIWYITLALLSLSSKNPYIIGLGLSLPLLGWFVNIYLEKYRSFWRKSKARNSRHLPELQYQRKGINEILAIRDPE